jgi:HSP20 family molecular chaperone IbpA
MMETAEVVEVKNAETPEKTRKTIYDELRRDLGDWMMAERDLVWRPAIELTEEGGELVARALVPGVHSKDVEVLVAPERLLVKGETHRGRPDHRQFLRSVEFPRLVDPEKVRAEITDGILSVRAKVAEARKVIIFRPRAA